MALTLTMVFALAAVDQMHPWLTFTREPMLERSVITVEVGPLQNSKRERIYLFRRTIKHGGNVEVSWADTRTCPAASWVVEESIKVPPPRIQVPGVKDPAADDQITLTMGGVGYSLNSGARYGSRVSSTIRFTSNVGTPLAAWVDESLQKLAPCWSHSPRQP